MYTCVRVCVCVSICVPLCVFICNYVYFVCVCLCVFMCTSDPWPEIAAHNRREGDRLEPIIPREGAD